MKFIYVNNVYDIISYMLLYIYIKVYKNQNLIKKLKKLYIKYLDKIFIYIYYYDYNIYISPRL